MPRKLRQAFLGIGANLGDRWATIRTALNKLGRAPGITIVEISAVYETQPVGLAEQPVFLNLVAGVETTLAPEELLALLRTLEHAAGRRRKNEIRWGPRTLDLDLLLYEGETRDDPELTLPHPRLWERAFVTVPLRDLLGKAAQFRQPAWKGARARLLRLPARVPGVKRWRPPKRGPGLTRTRRTT